MSNATVVKDLIILRRIIHKKRGHIIITCPTRPEKKKQLTAYHAYVGASSYATFPAQPFVPIHLMQTLLPHKWYNK